MTTWIKRGLSAVAAIVLWSASAGAQVAGRPFEISGGAGWFTYDTRARVQDGPAFVGRLGWRAMPWLSLEGQATFGPAKADTAPEQDHNFTYAGLDLRWNLLPPEGRAVPYLLTGYGYGLSHTEGRPPEKLERGAGSLGLGLLFNAFSPRSYVRFEARDVWFRERDALEFSNHIAYTAGLQYVFGGKFRDQDLDGVRDWIDRCPNTPIGAKVDAHGCPTDADADSVFDGIDKCAETPRGCVVDRTGCPTDADGDGVCDGLDQCADTPKGAAVDAKGCPTDADGDGVPSGVDKCEGTTKGCTVDATGCPTDADNDGVCDGLDACPNTPAGLRVDASGCPIEVNERETELLDTGVIRLRGINFETGKATILPESFALIDSAGAILQQYPMLRIEIGGHTDNRGSKALNERLSAARAQAVLVYLRSKFPGIDSTQYTAKGYGPNVPVASNTTNLGRAMNRRVEFKVTNTEALKVERERRRLLRKEEAPADTTK